LAILKTVRLLGDTPSPTFHSGGVWHLLADPTSRYRDLGPDFFDNRIRPRKINHVRQLEAHGYTVTLTPAA